MPGFHIGTSGFSYKHWLGTIYPEGLPAKRHLAWYAQFFDCVELNMTFYRLPKPGVAAHWHQEVPREFRFAVKGSRWLTHIKRLLDRKEGVHRFLESVEDLKEKRGPILWQLPPKFRCDVGRLDAFLGALPGLPHAVEFRDASWMNNQVFDLLDRHGAALVVHDLLDARWPSDLPGRFVYRRFHGATGKYSGNYSDGQLRAAARWLEKQDRDAWAFFNNDIGGHAFRNALQLKAYVEGSPVRSPAGRSLEANAPLR